jgi:prephenate dehydrogenase (NADP+)
MPINFHNSGRIVTNTTQDWSERVDLCAFEAYQEKFEKIQTYFGPRLPEAQRIGNEMIKTILEKTKKDGE